MDRHRYEVHNTFIDSFCAECDKFFEGEILLIHAQQFQVI
jgi:hypothetical protein